MGTFESAGTEVADLALEILGGEDPRTIEPRTSQALRVRCRRAAAGSLGDVGQELPGDSLVFFKTPTL